MNTYTVNITWNRFPKQSEAWRYLTDQTTTEILYGGGAGGGKSHLGCAWLTLMALKYAGTRWLMGRAVLKALKQSTLLTWVQLAHEWGLRSEVHYRYHEQSGTITFANGSEIYLKDLFSYPSDPEFDSLGSTEYTGAFIDEGSQVSQKAKDIVMSRLRYKLVEYGLVPKLLVCSNPAKNWMYIEFYKPAKAGQLKPYRSFVQSLVTDNPFISPHYIENLKKLPRVSQERLLYGNWEYDDDLAKLMSYDNIIAIFQRAPQIRKERWYLTCDVARFGNDKTVITLWHDLHIEHIWQYQKMSTRETRQTLEQLARIHNVPMSHILVDEDGVGGGIVDEMGSVTGFVNNSLPLREEGQKRNYKNLKSQCSFKAADYVNRGLISCYEGIPQDIKEGLITDLEQYKMKDPDKDAKLQIVGKEEIKENIGRSPDYGDSFMMRMYFELFQEEWVFFEDPEGLVL